MGENKALVSIIQIKFQNLIIIMDNDYLRDSNVWLKVHGLIKGYKKNYNFFYLCNNKISTI